MSSLFVIQGITCSVFYLQQKGQEQLFKKTFCGMFADQKICKECNHRWEINLLFSLRVVSQLLVNNLEVGQIFWDYHVTHNRDLSHNTDQSDYQKRKTWILCLLKFQALIGTIELNEIRSRLPWYGRLNCSSGSGNSLGSVVTFIHYMSSGNLVVNEWLSLATGMKEKKLSILCKWLSRTTNWKTP